MSGCAICVYDLYDEAMGRYREDIKHVKGRLRIMGVGENEWPSVLIGRGGSQGGSDGERTKNPNVVVMDAFEQLEREIHAKKVREGRDVNGAKGGADVREKPEGAASEKGGGTVEIRPGPAASKVDSASASEASLLRNMSEAVGWIIYSKR